MNTVLVTGGLGYIGSHTSVLLAGAGRKLVIVDNLANSKSSVLDRIRALVPRASIDFHRLDLRDGAALDEVIRRNRFDAVLHFAGLKAVAESVEKPELYFDNNVGGSRTLLEALRHAGIRRFVFSSSATVYGKPLRLPYTEDHPLAPENPYGETKRAIEDLLRAESAADPRFRFASLRYFNPIGAHPSGTIGEDPGGIPNNLVPFVAQVAVGRLPKLRVFGTDYDTQDGTGVRDFIHVMDLAAAHLAALQYLEQRDRSITVNVGTGRGHSVREVVAAFETASGKSIPLEGAPRRVGDVAASYADPTLAREELGWSARLGIAEMCRDAWCWQSRNPEGYP
jgi:UDP-glucose 4-epimerase